MRPLKTSDLFKLSAIVRELNLKKELQGLSKNGESSAEQFGLSLILILFENLDKAEDKILSFLSDIAEVKKTDIKEMNLDEFGELIEEFKQQKGLGDFFQSLFKKEK